MPLPQWPYPCSDCGSQPEHESDLTPFLCDCRAFIALCTPCKDKREPGTYHAAWGNVEHRGCTLLETMTRLAARKHEEEPK